MTTKIRQQNGITILEPNGKMMGPLGLRITNSTFAAVRCSRCTAYPH